MTHGVSLLVALKALAMVAGVLITYFAYQAYERTGAPALRALALGFGVVTLGALTAGVLDQFLAVERQTALIVESGMTTVGFGIVLYSLYAD
jgi:hypothetical protein